MPDSKSQSMKLNVSMPAARPLSIINPGLWIPDRYPGPADSDPDPFQPNVQLDYTFSRKFQFIDHNIENYDTYDAEAKKININ